jgi:hypothetical protein
LISILDNKVTHKSSRSFPKHFWSRTFQESKLISESILKMELVNMKNQECFGK